MTAPEVVRLFVVLAGYWPGSAPSPDDPVAVAAHLDLLGDLDLFFFLSRTSATALVFSVFIIVI